jgi:hypothetical protein
LTHRWAEHLEHAPRTTPNKSRLVSIPGIKCASACDDAALGIAIAIVVVVVVDASMRRYVDTACANASTPAKKRQEKR